jgi:hypothetical protein
MHYFKHNFVLYNGTESLFQSKDEPGEEAGRWWRKLLSGLDSEPI